MDNIKMSTAGAERMIAGYFTELIELLHDKIRRLEQEKAEQRREITRLKNEIRDLKKQAAGAEQLHED